MTSEGNYPADPYPGPHGYPPEGDDYGQPYQQHEAPHAYAAADRSRDGEQAYPGEYGQASPARAAISVPGLRAEPPSEAPAAPSPGQGGQVYGRPAAPTTYGRPSQPQMDERDDEPGPSAYPTPQQPPQAYGQPREPGVYGQSARPASNPENVDAAYQGDNGYPDERYQGDNGYPDERYPDDVGDQRNNGYAGPAGHAAPMGPAGPGGHGGRAAVPGARSSALFADDAPPAQWADHGSEPRGDQSPAEQANERPAPWAEERQAPWADERRAPVADEPPAPWADDAPRPQRLPGVYGQAVPAPQPLYGGAPSDFGPRDDEGSPDAAEFERRDERDLPSRNAPGYGPRDVSGFGAYDDRREGPGTNDAYGAPEFNRPPAVGPEFGQPRHDQPSGARSEFSQHDFNQHDINHPDFDRADSEQSGFTGSHADFAGPEINGHGRGFVERRDSDGDDPYDSAGPADFGAGNGPDRSGFAAPPPASSRGVASPPGAGRAQVPGTAAGMAGAPQFGGQPGEPNQPANQNQPSNGGEPGQHGFGDGANLPGRPFQPGDPYPTAPGNPGEQSRVNGAAPRSGGVVYGSPRVYGEPRPEPEDAENGTFGPPPSASGRAPIGEAPPQRPAHPGAAPAGPNQFGRATPPRAEPTEAEQPFDRTLGAAMPPGAAQSAPGAHPATTAFPSSPPFGGGPGRGFGSVPGPNGAAGSASPVSPGQAYQPIRPGQRPAGTVFGGGTRQPDGGAAAGGDGDRFDQRVDDGGDFRYPTSQPTGLLPEAEGPRRLRGRTIGIVAIVVVVVALLAGALYYTSRPNAPTYQIGACVQHSGDKVVGASCSMAGAFKIVSKVTDPSACPDTKNPYVSVDKTIYCLAPVQ